MSYFEFHCHTAPFSKDAGATLKQVIRRCQKKSVTGITITDHDEIQGALELKAIAPNWLTVVVGEEINTSHGEIIGIYLTEKIAPGLSPAETLAEIKRQGGISIVPHPFDRFRSKVLAFSELEKNIENIDILEIFNARNLLNRDNQKAFRFAQKHNKLVICASDAHFSGEYGRTFISNIDPTTPATFLATLKQENFTKKKSSPFFHLLTKWVKLRRRLEKRYGR